MSGEACKTTWTPGPWRTEGAHLLRQGSYAFVLGGPFIVATILADIDDLKHQAPANLRLIAAAPDLAAAAAAVLSHRVEGSTRGDLRDNDASRKALARLAAALAEAEGQ